MDDEEEVGSNTGDDSTNTNENSSTDTPQIVVELITTTVRRPMVIVFNCLIRLF